MKTLKHIVVLLIGILLINQLDSATNAQPSFTNQAFLTLDISTNPDKVKGSWNRNDPNLIFWSSFDLSVGLSFNYFNSWGLPQEISAYYAQIDNQTTACINDWDSYMCIDQFNCFNMGYNLTGNSMPLEFSTNSQYFTNVATTLGTTRLAVIEDNDNYWFKLYHQFSLTFTQQTQIYFNNCDDFAYDWTTAENYDQGKIPIKAVILHEIGHVLGLGHNNWSNGSGTLVMYDALVNEPDKLLFYLTVWDKVGIDAYWIHQGYMENPATPLEANQINQLLIRQHDFFEYEPEFLFYSTETTDCEGQENENLIQGTSSTNEASFSDKKLFIAPKKNKKEGVKK